MSKIDPRSYAVVLAQVALLCLAIHLLEIERGGGLTRIALPIFAGFAIHAWLPRLLKPPFFLAVSVAGTALVLGADTWWLLGLGLVLFGLCHLPGSLTVRALMVLAAGGGLAYLRVRSGVVEWSGTVVPVLASMFMFRVILYLRDQHRGELPISWARRLAYFFMLPNACFPLFPIVDYETYRKTYYGRPAAAIYQTGTHWMARGLWQLLIYRVVYHVLLPAPWEITDAPTLLQFIVASYALYLRISGQFHLIVGVLCLFGFDLPETHKRYFLASSFNDYWRRVNIYWKDFIEKVVFYPVFLRLRRWKVPQPLVVAILLTFAATWAFHSYQWFWLRGSILVTAPDVLFWVILGGAVAANSVWETRRRAQPAGSGFDLGAAAGRALQTVAMFTFLALLWSMWSGESLGKWVQHLALLGEGLEGWGILAAFAALAVGGGVLAQYLGSLDLVARLKRGTDPSRRAGVTLAMSAGLLVIGVLPASPAGVGRLAEIHSAVAHERLNEQDEMARTRGYYENLQTRRSLVGELWRTGSEMPDDWVVLAESEFHRDVQGQLVYELVPSMTGTYKRAQLSTNSHGMRDREYTVDKPPGTFRIALLGSSYTMGEAVSDDETYSVLVEDRLNREYAGGRYQRYEILDFAVSGYTHAHQTEVYEQKVRPFAPDVVILADHTVDGHRVIQHFAKRPRLMLSYPNPKVRAVADLAGIDRDSEEQLAEAALDQYRGRLTVALFEQITRAVVDDGAKMVLLQVPLTWRPINRRESAFDVRAEMARKQGMTLLSLEGAYGDRPSSELAVAPWDGHPHSGGHRLLAEALMKELLRADRELGMELTR